jgi:hypothetical protein
MVFSSCFLCALLFGLVLFLVGREGAVRWNVYLSGAEFERKEGNSDLNC